MPNPILDELTVAVTKTEGVIDSAIVFVQGVPALIEAAKAEVLANGATAEQLAPFDQLSIDLTAKADALAAAIVAPGGKQPSSLKK